MEFSAVTGRQAFDRHTAAETLAAILHEEPPSATDIAPRVIPVEFGRIIRHCLEKHPAATCWRDQAPMPVTWSLVKKWDIY